jgi:hypothetical protein
MESRKLSRSMRSTILSLLFVLFLCPGFALSAQEGWSVKYDPEQAGHPLRVAAYALHPVGVLVDYCLMRPAYWIVQKEPFATIFGADRPYKANDAKSEERP